MKEVGQKWAKYGRIPFIGNVQKRQIYRDKKQISWGTFLVVQWLRLHASTAGGISAQSLGRKLPHAMWCGQEKNTTQIAVYVHGVHVCAWLCNSEGKEVEKKLICHSENKPKCKPSILETYRTVFHVCV